MHKVKFKGKRKDNGEWVYGHYCKVGDKHYIILNDAVLHYTQWDTVKLTGFIEVIPETVGQFFCLDKHGEEVYAGDKTNCGIAVATFESWVWTYTKDHSTFYWHQPIKQDIELIKD